MSDRHVVIRGVGLELPGISADSARLWSGDPVAPGLDDFDPKAKLGRKGLLFKDRATKLAMCAGQTALQRAGLSLDSEASFDRDRFAVIVASNTGNLDTIARALDALREEGVRGTSPLDLPNASSNVVASTLAIRFGLRGINLMVTSGSTAGVDALALAWRLLRAQRADRVLVAGVEVNNDVTAKLYGDTVEAWQPGAESRLADGAAAVVLEALSPDESEGLVNLVGFDRSFAPEGVGARLLSSEDQLDAGRWLPPCAAFPKLAERLAVGSPALQKLLRQELSGFVGDAFGLQGVLGVAVATEALNERAGDSWAIISAGGHFEGPIATVRVALGQGARS